MRPSGGLCHGVLNNLLRSSRDGTCRLPFPHHVQSIETSEVAIYIHIHVHKQSCVDTVSPQLAILLQPTVSSVLAALSKMIAQTISVSLCRLSTDGSDGGLHEGEKDGAEYVYEGEKGDYEEWLAQSMGGENIAALVRQRAALPDATSIPVDSSATQEISLDMMRLAEILNHIPLTELLDMDKGDQLAMFGEYTESAEEECLQSLREAWYNDRSDALRPNVVSKQIEARACIDDAETGVLGDTGRDDGMLPGDHSIRNLADPFSNIKISGTKEDSNTGAAADELDWLDDL